ncbi:MAG: hypothetical protein ACOH1Y_17135 [Propionicimonas sp.]
MTVPPGLTQDSHVDLPADASNALLTAVLLDNLMTRVPALIEQVHALLGPVAESKTKIRARLLDAGQIIPIGPRTGASFSLAAVDGGVVIQQLYAADMIVAVAASADGMTSDGTQELKSANWATIVEHHTENSRLASAAMAALELKVMAGLTHNVRIIDGSHATSVIALSTALFAHETKVRDAVIRLLADDEILHAVSVIANPTVMHAASPGSEIIALPKSDSAHRFREAFATEYQLAATLDEGVLSGGDKFLASQVLQPGEMFVPRTVTELAGLHFPTPKDANRAITELCDAYDAAVEPLRTAAQDDLLQVTYLKPEGSDTVVKMEFRETHNPSNAAVTAARLARVVSDETPAPHLQEPFAQYAVDLAAKSVSAGTTALQQALLNGLPPEAEAYLPMLMRGYRT